jgi:hypothetical protein
MAVQFSAIQVEQAAKAAVETHVATPAWILLVQKGFEYILYIPQFLQDRVMLLPMIPTVALPLHRFARKVTQHSYFSVVILIVIILNTFVMAAVYHEAPKGYLTTLETINMILTWVFIVEFALKHIALGVQGVPQHLWDARRLVERTCPQPPPTHTSGFLDFFESSKYLR